MLFDGCRLSKRIPNDSKVKNTICFQYFFHAKIVVSDFGALFGWKYPKFDYLGVCEEYLQFSNSKWKPECLKTGNNYSQDSPFALGTLSRKISSPQLCCNRSYMVSHLCS